MATSKIEQLAALKAHLAELEIAFAADLHRRLVALPAEHGFPDVESFVAAVRAAAGKRRGRKPGAANVTGSPKRRRRAKITDETRASLKKLVKTGKTGSEIAAELRISLPTVQNIKKQLGLVKER